tara:strand:+ start:3217 stop:3399 length:183 start_codon:yes stop_codon:yes gene_type:complete
LKEQPAATPAGGSVTQTSQQQSNNGASTSDQQSSQRSYKLNANGAGKTKSGSKLPTIRKN